MKKILFINGSRGEWGYIRPIIEMCQEYSFSPHVCATNMAILDAYGDIASDVSAQGYPIAHKIFSSFEGGTNATMAKSIGSAIMGFVDFFASFQPDWVLLAGDRGEQLAAAIASSYMYIPTAHIQAGEVSGNIDGMARHAITKLSHLHFASNRDAYDRLIKMGEEEFRIHNVGAPQLDDMANSVRLTSIDDFNVKHRTRLQKKCFILVVYHGVTEDSAEDTAAELNSLMQALRALSMQLVYILPNNDGGSGAVRSKILENRIPEDIIFDNLDRSEYLMLLSECFFLIGNSSSGILEAPTYKTPVINIGRRQHGRLQSANIINANGTMPSILSAIEHLSTKSFIEKCTQVKNPYGEGDSAKRILTVLNSIVPNNEFLVKRITY